MNRILTATAAGLAGLMLLAGPALADRDDDRWRGHDGRGKYERHDRDHDRDRGRHEWRHGDRDHDRDRDRRPGWHSDRKDWHKDRGKGWDRGRPYHQKHAKHHWRYKHDHRFWGHYDRWYRTHGYRHHRDGWDRRDGRLVIIYERWLDDHYRYRGRDLHGGIYLNFPLRIGF